MKIQVSALPEGQNTFQWSSDKEPDLAKFAAGQIAKGYALQGNFRLDLDLTRLEPDYYLRGRLHYTLAQPCVLCAEVLTAKTEAPFELALIRTDKVRGGTARLAEETDDLDILCFNGNELHLDAILDEQFVLSVPLQPECGTPACLERSRQLMDKVHETSDHWKDQNSPFSVLKNLKK